MLYAITDSHLLAGDLLIKKVEAALMGGCRWVQYRDKSGDALKRLTEASDLLSLCSAHNAKLIINDDVQLAKTIGAHGVHLGQEDGDPAAARALLGANAIIGVTCHDSLPLARTALEKGANYIAFGRFFPSKTKPDARPAPLELIAQARAEFGEVVIAVIGGITLANAPQLINAGANLIATSQGLFATDEVQLRAQLFSKLFNH